jgi:two-component system nitrate/nitrite sensor histidine kinase NarX
MISREAATPEFPARLNRRLGIAQALILIAVLIAGGLALASAVHLSRINRLIDEQYTHSLAIEQVHVTFQELLGAAEQIEIDGRARRFERLGEIEEQLVRQIAAVIAGQTHTGAPTDRNREPGLIGDLQRKLAELRPLTASLASLPDGRLPRPQDLDRLEVLAEQGTRLARQLVNVHQERVRELLQLSHRRLHEVIALYLVLLAVGVALVITTGLLASRWIRAVLRLSEVSRLIAEDRLEARVPIPSRDEVGQLSHAFNVMADRLQARQAELLASETQLRRKISEIHALYRIGNEISGLTELDPTLQWVVDKARELLGADGAALCLVSPGGDQLIPRARSGPQEVLAGADQAIPLLLPDGSRTEPCAAVLELFPPGRILAYLTSPLRRGATAIGVLVVGTVTPREFSADDRELAAGLATQAAIAIDNARLYEEVQDVAKLEERRRLAREIHDGMAQTLALLHLKLQQFRSLLPLEDSHAMETAALQEVCALAESAYEEVRQSIVGLRTAVSRSLGFIPTLAKYVEEFSAQHAIPVEFSPPEDSPVPLSPAAETEVMRIIQEALTNVRKHAAAGRARVQLRVRERLLRVSIEDDGRGWDLVAVPPSTPSHVGLAIMRERAESLGGSLRIVTAPGRGTRITAEVPLEVTR